MSGKIQDKIFASATDLAPVLADLKQQGKVIVTTNGIYDFLHAGHVEYLEMARHLGDALVVILNTDASTKRIKGPARPINAEQDRAFVAAGLGCVDYVTFFDEDTPTQVLDILKPDLHAKGGDYDPDKMPETATIRKNGGDVRIIPLKQGYSNSKQFQKIKEAAEYDEKFQRPDWLAGSK
ncbi:MAG: adenylyltransferase/cytidyltransferase family protein [Alphaproteobacteria bacterium]|nr:adenylyltransferase/cytidyltransferase family protein [Alphaproteobacteria bacterium]